MSDTTKKSDVHVLFLEHLMTFTEANVLCGDICDPNRQKAIESVSAVYPSLDG